MYIYYYVEGRATTVHPQSYYFSRGRFSFLGLYQLLEIRKFLRVFDPTIFGHVKAVGGEFVSGGG